MDSSYDNWESRSSAARDRSPERGADRSTTERTSERVPDRDRYEGERREQPRDSSYDRRGGHGERDRRDTRDRGETTEDNLFIGAAKADSCSLNLKTT